MTWFFSYFTHQGKTQREAQWDHSKNMRWVLSLLLVVDFCMSSLSFPKRSDFLWSSVVKKNTVTLQLSLGKLQSLMDWKIILKKKVRWVKVGVCSPDRCCFEQEKKSPEKGSPRSRIPRLVLHPFRPKDKGSPLSDSPFSEEEGKECDISSDHSKRTISTNSFCSGKKFSSGLRTTGFMTEKKNLTTVYKLTGPRWQVSGLVG